MRVGLFERIGLAYAKAFWDGVEKCGDRPVGQNPNVWSPQDALTDLDVAVVFGMQWQDRVIAEKYRALSIPVVVVELGYINRCHNKYQAEPGQYFRVGLDSLSWLPDWSCPSDRRLALDVKRPKPQRCQDGYVLLLGQKPGDAQHWMGDMAAWRVDRTLAIKECTQREIRWRRHPKDERTPRDPDESARPLAEDLTGAWCAVTHNSTAGMDAIQHGVPVICDESAIYVELCGSLETIEKPYYPSTGAFNGFFNRLCYAQWDMTEFAGGEAWNFIKGALTRRS